MLLLPVFHLHFLSSDSNLKTCDGGLWVAHSVRECVCVSLNQCLGQDLNELCPLLFIACFAIIMLTLEDSKTLPRCNPTYISQNKTHICLWEELVLVQNISVAVSLCCMRSDRKSGSLDRPLKLCLQLLLCWDVLLDLLIYLERNKVCSVMEEQDKC